MVVWNGSLYTSPHIERGALLFRKPLTDFRRRRRRDAYFKVAMFTFFWLIWAAGCLAGDGPLWVLLIFLLIIGPPCYLAYRLNMNWTRLGRGVGIYELGFDMIDIEMMYDAYGPWKPSRVFVPWEELGDLFISGFGKATPTFDVVLLHGGVRLTCPHDLVDDETVDVASDILAGRYAIEATVNKATRSKWRPALRVWT